MQIGTIGAGDLAQAFAKRVMKAGYEVKLSNSRGPESLREIVRKLGPGATAPNREDNPAINGAKRVAFISADDADAKKRVHTLLHQCGYSVVDLGSLRDGGLMQQAGGPLAGRDFFERGEYSR